MYWNIATDEYMKNISANRHKHMIHCYHNIGIAQRKAKWLMQMGFYETAEIFVVGENYQKDEVHEKLEIIKKETTELIGKENTKFIMNWIEDLINGRY